MNEYIISFPCFNEKFKIYVDSSGNPTAFLLKEKSISQEELSNIFGIELGIVDSNKDVN